METDRMYMEVHSWPCTDVLLLELLNATCVVKFKSSTLFVSKRLKCHFFTQLKHLWFTLCIRNVKLRMSLCWWIIRSRTGFRCLSTSFCQHPRISAVVCALLLHDGLSWCGQWGNSFYDPLKIIWHFPNLSPSFRFLNLFAFFLVCDGWCHGNHSDGWIQGKPDEDF